MVFDKGATTFDLQDTEFYDKYELFDTIRNSSERHDYVVIDTAADLRQSIAEHYKLK